MNDVDVIELLMLNINNKHSLKYRFLLPKLHPKSVTHNNCQFLR